MALAAPHLRLDSRCQRLSAIEGKLGMSRSILSSVLAAVFAVSSCGANDSADISQPVTTVPVSTTTEQVTTSHPATTSLASTTTTERAEAPVTVEDVVGGMQAMIDQEFAESDPPEGVIGPNQLECMDTGPVHRGTVFACASLPQTEPDFPLDPTGALAYVTDDSGTAAWVTGTDIPDRTENLLRIYEESPKGLYCRDLTDPDVETWFSSAAVTDPTGYVLALVYWSLEGEPDRMDEDLDGVPCESLFEPEVVNQVLTGGPMQ